MIRSMTGFGKGEYRDSTRQCTVEIKTVNHRYADYTVKMPREFLSLEDRIRHLLQQYIIRGKADIYITYTDLSPFSKVVAADEGLIQSYIDAIRETAQRHALPIRIDADIILQIPDAFVVTKKETDTASVWELLRTVVIQAAENLTIMREKEGAILYETFLKLIDTVEMHFHAIAQRSSFVPQEYKEKLHRRLEDLLGTDTVDPQRIAAEVALFADRCNIDEEIDRMRSHILQFRDILQNEGAVGRKLDFLVQEMNREVNTMGSKANDITITNHVIALKSEIEKIREQIQNVE